MAKITQDVNKDILPAGARYPTSGTGEDIAKAAVAVVNTAVNLRADKLNENLGDELLAAQEEVLAEAEAPTPRPEMSDGDARVAAEFSGQMARIQNAAEQGTMPVTELKIKQEKILRQYMTRYPKLVPEFQRTATGTLGYNPIGAEIEALEAGLRASQSRNQALYNAMVSAATQAGINPIDRVMNPQAYWTRAYAAFSDIEKTSQVARDLSALQNTQALNKANAMELLTNVTGPLAGSALAQEINPIVNQFTGLTAAELEGAAQDGSLEAARQTLIQRREEFLLEVYSNDAYDLGAAGLTLAEVEAAVKPVLQMYDSAITNIGLEGAAERLNAQKGIVENRFLVENPDAVRLNAMADLLGVSGTSPLADAARMQAAGRVGEILTAHLNASYGGRSALDVPGVQDGAASSATLPVPADPTNPDAVEYHVLDRHSQAMSDALTLWQQASDPGTKMAHAEAWLDGNTRYANTYLRLRAESGVRAPEIITRSYIDTLADPAVAELVGEDSLRRRAQGTFATRNLILPLTQNMGRVLNTEYGELMAEWRDIVGAEGDSDITEFLRTKWTPGRGLVLTVADDAPRQAKLDLNEAIGRFNVSSAQRDISQIVKAYAHINGTTDYEFAGNQFISDNRFEF